MLKKILFFEIRRDALRALKEGSSTWSFYTLYYSFPIAFAAFTHYIGYTVNTKLFENLISGISLFAGMLFSIIFVVSNNFSNRKSKLDPQNEEDLRYLNRYKKFSNNIISLISYVVVKAIILIIILIVSDGYLEYLKQKPNLFLRIIWDLLLVFSIQFILYVMIILKEMYKMQYDDINR